MKTAQSPLAACLVMAALYAPLLWYMSVLRSRIPGQTGFLELQAMEQIIIISLMLAPLWCLPRLNIRWQPEQPLALVRRPHRK